MDTDQLTDAKAKYIQKLQGLTDRELFTETKDNIWLSAYAANNPRSAYHWHARETYNEWERRGNLDQYERAFEAAKKEAGC